MGETVTLGASAGVGTHVVTLIVTNGTKLASEKFSFSVTTALERIEMVDVPGGIFQMGSTTGWSWEQPVHQVTLTGFLMGKYEVTQAQYQSVTGTNPSFFSGTNLPVEIVTWYDTVEFCNKLSDGEGYMPVYTITGRTPVSGYPITSATVTMDMTKNGYRLPTEAEWEYAARGGSGSPGEYTYSGSNDINAVAWWGYDSTFGGIGGNAERTTHTVGTKAGNELDLYDMTGNVDEWCNDWWGWDDYKSGAQTDPVGASSAMARIIRGGNWRSLADECRSASRGSDIPYIKYKHVGFRVVRRP